MAQQLRPDRAWGLRPSIQYDTPADPTTSSGSGVWGRQTGEISTQGHQFSCLSLPLRQPVVLLPRRVEVPHPAPEPSGTLVRWSATLACSGSSACHPPAVSATPPRQPPPLSRGPPAPALCTTRPRRPTPRGTPVSRPWASRPRLRRGPLPASAPLRARAPSPRRPRPRGRQAPLEAGADAAKPCRRRRRRCACGAPGAAVPRAGPGPGPPRPPPA